MGRLPNDHQSQRALGIDTGNRALCVFRGAVAGGGQRDSCGRKLEIRTAPARRQIRQTRLAPLEKIRASQVRQGRRRNPPTDKKAADADRPTIGAATSSAIPPSVANANAQLASADTPTGNAPGDDGARQRHCAGRADKPADAQPPPTPRSLPPISSTTSIARCSKAAPAAQPVALASAEAPAAPAAPVMASSAATARPGTRPR